MLQFVLMFCWSGFRPSPSKQTNIVVVEVILPSVNRMFRKVDLNTSNVHDWMQFGISEKVSKRTIKYLNTRGDRVKVDDLLNVFGFPKELYIAIKPFILIRDVKQSRQLTSLDDSQNQLRKPKLTIKPKVHYSQKLSVSTGGFSVFALNAASAEDLMRVKGVGKVLSKRIIRFRSKLGGFHSSDQLTEVYGLESVVVDRIKKQSTLDSSVLQIPINSVDVFTLSQHPYINKRQAALIVSFRAQHGAFESLDKLKEIEVFTEAFVKKIKPYLTITH